jgi:cytolysin (calcineurin-like family phosphatase)
VSWCIEHRVNIVSNAPIAQLRKITDAYRSQWMAAGHDAATLPFMGTARHVVIATTDYEALAIARQAEAGGLNYLLLRFAFGDLTLAESMRSVELFAAEVMPAFVAGA